MPNRTSPRHPEFDYRIPAAYFVTVCVHDHRCLFGTVRRGRMHLNEIGQIAAAEWQRSEEMRDEVILDAFVIMPNHLHGIVCLVPPDVDAVTPRGYDLTVGPPTKVPENTPNDDVGTHRHASLRERGKHSRWEEGKPQRHAQSLGSMVAGFKGAATKRINQYRETPSAPVWHADRSRHTIHRSQERALVPTTVGMAGLPAVRRTESRPVAPRPKPSRPSSRLSGPPARRTD